MNHNTSHSQRGATLVVGMIMLVLLTLFVVAAVNMSSVNMRILGNTQVRSEALAAGQQAIEQIASTDFPKNPAAAAGPINVDVNGDGVVDYIATIAVPVCQYSTPIKSPTPGAAYNELNASIASDQPCFGSITSATSGIVGSGGAGDSACSKTQWDVNATVSDSLNAGSAVIIHQGISRRIATGDVSC